MCKVANTFKVSFDFGRRSEKAQRDGEIPPWIIFRMIHHSCPVAAENNSSREYLAYHLLAHKQDGNERFYHSFSLLCARSPHHQLGEK